ncbi:stalk domain-containing protein [Paenibacillus pasadenensis]|uniref:stalk domain-containing protein n=1 Tax=Paenibacillus pasadenensis TaxID=217090 RepID=UPI002041BB1D|nr:stalk domain-containing protein [Paenibacillus pasadenensis]MCM3746492.1 stalk domain-containing protein [Paenibacillus pasadenensis]
MKLIKGLTLLSLAAAPLYGMSGTASAEGGAKLLTLTKGSSQMMLDGTSVTAVQPMTIKNNFSYVAFSTLAQLYGYKTSYDAKSKESIAKTPSGEIRFRMNTKDIWVDGVKWTGEAPSFSQKGSLMIPVRTWAKVSRSSISFAGKNIMLSWADQPSAAFQIQPSVIHAGEAVQYIDQYSSPAGLPLLSEEWTGKQDVFTEPGTYTVTRRVQDASGIWSEPYSADVQVLAVNQPPVADFSTDKEVYRQGEQIQYSDLSTDDNNAIDTAKTKWTGRQNAFFEPGEKTVTLTVTDNEGLTSTISKTIQVTDEILYTQEEYGLLFTPAGEKISVDGAHIKDIPKIKYGIESEPSKMMRSNSPELWTSEGIAFDDQFDGKVRMLFHNKNTLGYNVKMYLAVTNEGFQTSRFGVKATGMGGPDPSEIRTGKLSTIRYLTALNNNVPETFIDVKPGQTELVLQEISAVPIKPGMVYSAYADVSASSTLRFRVIVVADGKDPLAEMDSMELMPADGKHTRGSFNNTDRDLIVDGVIGEQPQQILLGDNNYDPYLDGYDNTDGSLQLNRGNFGVLYKMSITLAPRTVVYLNPRGGLFAGAFIINGQLVPVTNNEQLKDQNEGAVLYRSGDSVETVEFKYMTPSGSNLPVTMVFQPMPGLKN